MIRIAAAFSLLLATVPLHANAGLAFPTLHAIADQPYAQTAKPVEIRGEQGDPAPQQWTVLFADVTARGGLREITITNGRILGERTPLKDTAGAAKLLPLDAAKLKADADVVFRTAVREAIRCDVGFDWINYTLRTDSQGQSPVWDVRLFKQSGAPVAKMRISAQTAAVVGALEKDRSGEWLKNTRKPTSGSAEGH